MFIEILKSYNQLLNENLIKRYHYCLKAGVFVDAIDGYPCGEYKNRTNTVRGIMTASPDTVHNEMIALLSKYPVEADMESLARFHVNYEKIHPFQDGNGRTGRAILFKECLRTGKIPVIVLDSQKGQYYEALNCAQKKDDISLLCSFFKECQRKYYEYVREFLYDYAEEEKNK